jgi:hypothetical protein
MMLHDPEIGHRLLLQSTPVENRQQAEQLIKQRTASHQLFAIKSARVNHDNKHSKVPKSMPGIGHPFWKNRSDHMHSYVMPPAIHKQLLGEKEIPTTQLMQTYKNYNLENWQPSVTNMYYMKHEQTQLVKTPNNIPVMRIPVLRTDHKQIFQNGQQIIPEQTYVAFHGTRELLIEPILKNGLKASIHSHSIIGTWCNLASDEALEWTSSIFDFYPSVAIEIAAPIEHVRSNADIKQGNHHRLVIKLMEGQTWPAIYICAILIALPTLDRRQLHEELQDIFNTSIQWITRHSHLLRQQAETMKKKAWKISSFRFAYANMKEARLENFGGLENAVHTCTICPFINFVIATHALTQLTNDDNRKSKLEPVQYHSLTPIMRTYLEWFHPNIMSWCTNKTQEDIINTRIIDVSISKLITWGPVNSHEEAVQLKLIADQYQQ